MRRALAEVIASQEAKEDGSVRTRGIDEFSLRKGHHDAPGLHDLDGRRVVTVIQGRTQEKGQKALDQLPHPAAVQVVLPDALIVADTFHVDKPVTKAVWHRWRRLRRGKPQDDPLRQDGALALRADERLNPVEGHTLDPLLRAAPLLRRAHRLKEVFRRW